MAVRSVRMMRFALAVLAGPARACTSVELVEQTSRATCTLGVSFGCEGPGVMYAHGCRGRFRCVHPARSPIIRCGYPPGAPHYRCLCNDTDGSLDLHNFESPARKPVSSQKMLCDAATGGQFHPRKVVFWHLQKGGGMQILSWLARLHLDVELIPEYGIMPAKFWSSSYFRIGLIREPCEYHVSEYLWGRRLKNFSLQGLGDMRYALEGQGVGSLYQGDVRSGFKSWLKFITKQDIPNPQLSCGVLGARLWTQIINATAARLINRPVGQLRREPGQRCVATIARPNQTRRHCAICRLNNEHTIQTRSCALPCPLADCMRSAPGDLGSACHAEVSSFRREDRPFDCWLRTDRLQNDFLQCMKLCNSRIATRAESMIQRERNRTVNEMIRPAGTMCDELHDRETASLVYRLDGAIARQFGYSDGCCRPHPAAGMLHSAT
mmetsp:Transcript_45527/g.143227  ORF Transcript_45527/g.143227 Transcript_45527/m.143227 type:complete len:437 (+) Transcript_45527:442-1752(+)